MKQGQPIEKTKTGKGGEKKEGREGGKVTKGQKNHPST